MCSRCVPMWGAAKHLANGLPGFFDGCFCRGRRLIAKVGFRLREFGVIGKTANLSHRRFLADFRQAFDRNIAASV